MHGSNKTFFKEIDLINQTLSILLEGKLLEKCNLHISRKKNKN